MKIGHPFKVEICSIFQFLIIILSINLNVIHCEIIPFHNHVINPLQPEYWTFNKFQKSDAPTWSPGHGHSYIDLSRLKFQSSCATSSSSPSCNVPSKLDILMFEEPNEHWLDYWDNYQFCCTPELIDSGDCTTLGTLIYPASFPNSVITRLTVHPPQSAEPETQITNEIVKNDILKTDVYILFIAACDPSAPAVTVNGFIESMDPYGYLPADQFPNLPFYELICVCYLFLAIAWSVLCFIHLKDLMVLQHWISGVLSFGLVETAVLYGYYLNWNDTGSKNTALLVTALIFGVCKRTLSRIVLQFVALGYGIVRPTLGDDLYRVLYLGGTYFVLSLIYVLSTNFNKNSANVDDPEYNFITLCILMLAGVDTTFYIWIITSINNIMITLAARKQAVKYVLYRNFRFVLFVSLFCTFGWIIYSSVITVNNGKGDQSNWKYKWTIDAMWEFIYFILFVIVCVLWSPHKNNHRYAYSYDNVNLEDDEEWANAGQVNNDGGDDDDARGDSNNAGGGTAIEMASDSNENIISSSSSMMKDNNISNGTGTKYIKKKKTLLDDSDDEDDDLIKGSGGGALDSKNAILKKN